MCWDITTKSTTAQTPHSDSADSAQILHNPMPQLMCVQAVTDKVHAMIPIAIHTSTLH